MGDRPRHAKYAPAGVPSCTVEKDQIRSMELGL
jgi:hypothetical protein